MADRILRATEPPYWWENCGEIARLLQWLDADTGFGPLDVEHCIEIVSSPWSWDDEYQQMCREQAA